MTTTLLALEQLLSQAIGDDLEFDTTTNIGAGVTVVSTTLTSYDGGKDDYFNDFWVYITEGNNIGVLRQVSDYATATGTLTVRGANLAAEAGAVTCRLHRYNRATKKQALQRAIEMTYPTLYKPVDDMTLVTGNILPDASFEWWTSSSAMKLYTATNVTLAKNTSSTYIRGQFGTFSAKATATAGGGLFSISSADYSPLLDLQGKTVNFYCWAFPQVADDPSIVIYTVQPDGTTQTLTSATTSYAGRWNLISLESQTLNDDLDEIQIRFKIATNAKYVYWDEAILCGMNLHDYLLPWQFQAGTLSQSHVQAENYSDIYAYDIKPRAWEEYQHRVDDDGTYRYLHLLDLPENYHRMRLVGFKPLDSLSSDTDTIHLEGERLNLIVYKAAQLFFESLSAPPASEDQARYEKEALKWDMRYRLNTPRLMMMRPSGRIWTGNG